MPGLERFSNRQMFWLSWSRTWCLKYPKENIETIYWDTHSVGKYRIKGPIQNLEKFSKDFNCPKGSPMNPETKCNLWN